MKKILFLLLILTKLNLYCQYDCNRMIVADSSDFEFLQDNFIPNETTPFLTIKISFHIWRKHKKAC